VVTVADFSGASLLARAAWEAVVGAVRVTFLGKPWEDDQADAEPSPGPVVEGPSRRPHGPVCDRCGGNCWDDGTCTWCGIGDVTWGCWCTLGHEDVIPTPGPHWGPS